MAVGAGELSPEFEDRFVQRGLADQIAPVMVEGFGVGVEAASLLQEAVKPTQRKGVGGVQQLSAGRPAAANFETAAGRSIPHSPANIFWRISGSSVRAAVSSRDAACGDKSRVAETQSAMVRAPSAWAT
ncbi:MAG: hypothetical protein M3488_13575 [Actinomycetota bacterium]|nr:hypothetical protein [Actinomycetota bacterium]